MKPSNYILKATSTPEPRRLANPLKPASTPRRTLQPKSPAARINTCVSKPTPTTAPAGRSPTRGKRSGLLSSRRQTAGPYTRVDPPSFNLSSSSGAPFSLDAALKGTIPGYNSRSQVPAKDILFSEPTDVKAGWFFEIHEDTKEQEMTNLLQHSTCVLDISSDEESEEKAQREKDEGRDKENVPPSDDVSQTAARYTPRLGLDDMVVEKERVALGEMNAADFYPPGYDQTSVVLVPADEEESFPAPLHAQTPAPVPEQCLAPLVGEFDFALELKHSSPPSVTAAPLIFTDGIDDLISKSDEQSGKAAVLQPIEGTGDSFELWESGSANDETETVIAEPMFEEVVQSDTILSENMPVETLPTTAS